MKKLLTIALALVMALSLVACGGSDPAPAPAAPAPATAAPKAEEKKPDLANPEYSAEQLAVAEKFAAMSDRMSGLVDKVNGDENLSSITELIDTMNVVIDAMNEDDALFADPANLTPEVLKNLEEDIVIGNKYVDELEAMIKNYSGKETVTVPVEIINETGADLFELGMSPANNDDWGGNLLDEPLLAGESGVSNMTFSADTLVWDLLAADSEGTTLTFMGIDFSEAPTTGAKLMLSATEGGAYLASFVE
ncbi:MAG: hypothetical protein RR846_05110 [Oscillospiraceae bacterium]